MKTFFEKGVLHSTRFADICRAWDVPLVFISDANVYRYHGERIKHRLLEEEVPVQFFVFPAGEKYKTRTTKEFLENQMLEAKVRSDALVVGFGGGVTTDMAGFIASTYYRGLPLLLIPTTLLAMVDACFGGKNGVNTPHGKNLIGTLYPPAGVILDIDTFDTLPDIEYRQGIVEMIKHATLFDKKYFHFLCKNVKKIQNKDPTILLPAIEKSIAIKNKVVDIDLRGTGLRNAMNFGHTLGHALEMATQHRVSHGDAVSWGMIWEAEISRRLGRCSAKDVDEIKQLLIRFGLLGSFPLFDRESFFSALDYDKKQLSEGAPLILLPGIGAMNVDDRIECSHVDLFCVQEVIEETPQLAFV